MAKKVQKMPQAPDQLALQKQRAPQTQQQQQEAIRVKAAYTAHKNLNTQLPASQSSVSLVQMQTLSGRSLGSLGEYNSGLEQRRYMRGKPCATNLGLSLATTCTRGGAEPGIAHNYWPPDVLGESCPA